MSPNTPTIRNRLAALAAGLGVALAAGAAAAAPWPTSIVGSYSGGANATSIYLNVSYQAASTSAGGCVAIAGTLQDLAANTIDPIKGYYCPASGNMMFVRNDPASGQTFQAYYASWAATAAAQSNKLGGVFYHFAGTTQLGVYPFTVSTPIN